MSGRQTQVLFRDNSNKIMFTYKDDMYEETVGDNIISVQNLGAVLITGHNKKEKKI